MAGTPSRCATSSARAGMSVAPGGRCIRVSASDTACPSTSFTLCDCERSTRNASVRVGPRVESGDRFSNSASRIGWRSLMSPFACNVPTDPIPSARITEYAMTIAASAPNASPPPRIAFRHVKCFATPASGTRYVPVAAAITRSRSFRPVTSMIGRPIASNTTAPTNTQSGSPSFWRSTNIAISTAIDASTNSAATRIGRARRSAASAPDVNIRGIAGVAPVGAMAPLGVAMAWSCVSSSSARCTRSAGFFSRQRITSALSAGDTEVRCVLSGAGASVTCAASTCCGDIPLNGGCPQSISYAIAPTA